MKYQTPIYILLNLSFLGYIAGVFWFGERVSLVFLPLFGFCLIVSIVFFFVDLFRRS